ncbi:MAG: molecular chaperone DnaJ, partial [Myxococcaceae bacterium]|nr:molecular chaperone DnaJ [Myxococcaceae bacterium]
MSAVAEALLNAHKQRASGWLTLTFSGRESKLLLKEGDLVGAQMGFGHQSALQGLLQSKRLTLGQLDALWARGDAGKADAETLEEVGASAAETSTQAVLAQVRRLATLAAQVKFEAGDVSSGDATVSGVEVVRAAFESVAAEDAPAKVYRCVDLRACGEWLLNPDERALLEGLGELKPPGKIPLSHRVLLELLEREGKVESMVEADWRARLDAEERQRAEEARLEAERIEAERIEAERIEAERKAEEARLAEEQRKEEERRAEEERLAEEQRKEEERKAEEARLAEEQRQNEERKAEEARLAEEQRLEEERQA